MAPVRRSCRVRSDLRRLKHKSGDSQHAVHRCAGGYVANSMTVRTCPTAHGRRRRRHRLRSRRFCWLTLRHDDDLLLTKTRRIHSDVVLAAAAAVNARDDDDDDDDDDDESATHRDCIATRSLDGSVRGVQQRHLVTFLYCAALVDQLTHQLSQLRLHTESRHDDDTDEPVSSLSPADCDEQLASSSSNNTTEKMLPGDMTTSHNSNAELSRPTDELRPTSMITLLRRSCRIPRPVAVDRTVRASASSHSDSSTVMLNEAKISRPRPRPEL